MYLFNAMQIRCEIFMFHCVIITDHNNFLMNLQVRKSFPLLFQCCSNRRRHSVMLGLFLVERTEIRVQIAGNRNPKDILSASIFTTPLFYIFQTVVSHFSLIFIILKY